MKTIGAWVFTLFLIGCVSQPARDSEIRSGWLPAVDGHEIYFEDAGPLDGLPAVYLHGGPGSGSNPNVRRFFDSKRYRVITFDQRGTGKSRFIDLLEHNTSADLVKDMERLRIYLGVNRWVVVGGSWGSTLGLLYAEKHPSSVRALLLWGIFLGTREELPWLHPNKFPIRWRSFSRGNVDPTGDYHRRLEDPSVSEGQRVELARRWRAYENLIKEHEPNDGELRLDNPTPGLVRATRIKLAYMAQDSFLEHSLLDDVNRLAGIPGAIIQGTADPICPATAGAAQLHAAWPAADYISVPGGVHSASDPKMAAALTAEVNKLTGSLSN